MRRGWLPLLLAFLLLVGCSERKVSDKHPAVSDPSEPRMGTKAEVKGTDFVYRLVSEKPVYADGEHVALYAELEYVGEQPEVRVAHAASIFSFPMREKTRGYTIDYAMPLPRIQSVLKKGVPIRESYRGSGSYGSDDPKDFVDFMKVIMAGNGTFPSGLYRVSGTASFELLDGEDIAAQNQDIQLQAEIEFEVQ